MMIRSLSPTAFSTVLILILFPSAANAFFESPCTCNKVIPAANGTTGSANCQTGATCDPSKLREDDTCTVSCIQPFAQPVYKSGLSWLTADKINCTSGVFYANNKMINPTLLNCKILPRCDQCTYTMSEICPVGYSCSSSPLLEKNPYTNCTTLRCPNGYTGSAKRSDGTVVRLDSTLTCTAVNNQWKDYAGTFFANLELTCAAFGTHPPTTSTSTTTTTSGPTTPTTTTTRPCDCKGYGRNTDCSAGPCAPVLETSSESMCRELSCPDGYQAERHSFDANNQRVYEAVAGPVTCVGQTWVESNGKETTERMNMTCSTPGGPLPCKSCSSIQYVAPATCPPGYICDDASVLRIGQEPCIAATCAAGSQLVVISEGSEYAISDAGIRCMNDGVWYEDVSDPMRFMYELSTPTVYCKKRDGYCPAPSLVFEEVISSFHLKLGLIESNKTHAWCTGDLLGYIDNGTTYRQINGPVVLTCDLAARVWRQENGVIMGTADKARLMCSQKRCQIPYAVGNIDPAFADVLGMESPYYTDNFIGCNNGLVVYVVRKGTVEPIVFALYEQVHSLECTPEGFWKSNDDTPKHYIGENIYTTCGKPHAHELFDEFTEPLTPLPSVFNFFRADATAAFYYTADGCKMYTCSHPQTIFWAQKIEVFPPVNIQQPNPDYFYEGTIFYPERSQHSYDLYSGGQMVVKSNASRAISCMRPAGTMCPPLEVLYHDASGYLPSGYVLDRTANPIHHPNNVGGFYWTCGGGQSDLTMLVYSDGVSNGTVKRIQCSYRDDEEGFDVYWSVDDTSGTRLPETGAKIFCAIPGIANYEP